MASYNSGSGNGSGNGRVYAGGSKNFDERTGKVKPGTRPVKGRPNANIDKPKPSVSRPTNRPLVGAEPVKPGPNRPVKGRPVKGRPTNGREVPLKRPTDTTRPSIPKGEVPSKKPTPRTGIPKNEGPIKPGPGRPGGSYGGVIPPKSGTTTRPTK